MAKVGLFYGSSTGVTKNVAEAIATELKQLCIIADVKSASEASIATLTSYDKLLLGTSTWGMGDLQDDWEGLLSSLATSNLKGKTVALFGTGDQDSYPDTFVDGIGHLYKAVKSAGAEVVGFISTDGYSFDASTAEKGGQFVGLVIDEGNQGDLTATRIKKWVASISGHFEG
jgi:flavodoxin I